MIALLRIVVPALVFIGFIAFALRVKTGQSSGRSLRTFVAYVLVVSCGAGLTGRDLWPFAAWRFVGFAVPESSRFLRAMVVDERGTESPVEDRAFEPLEPAEFWGWVDERLDRLTPADLDELLEFLLAREREALARVHLGLPIGRFQRFLGPLAAPSFAAEVRPWIRRETLPNALTGLRLYRDYWRISDGRARIERRELIASIGR